jgi:hypothetical protein
MTTNRNYAAVPQAPTALGYTPTVLNQRATNSAVLPAQQYIAAAAETLIVNPAVSSPAAPVPLCVAIPSRSLVEGQPFELLISGDIFVGGATPTALFKLYSGQSATLANNLLIASTAAVATATNLPFSIRASLVGDSGAGKIWGTFKSLIGGVLGAEAAIAAVIPNVNFNADPVASFLFTVTPNNANANSSILVKEFAINF